MTSFVPKGQLNLITENSIKAEVVEEEIKENVVKTITDVKEEIVKTASKIDRSKAPETGESPKLKIPASWNATLTNEMKVYGIEQNEIPTVNFSLVIDGGHLLDIKDKNGIANLMTDIMMEGTADKTPEQLEEEIENSNSFSNKNITLTFHI